MKNNNIIQERSFTFALSIIQLYKKLVNQKEFVISKQILKSGTSIGANIEEAVAAQSRKDFLHKMSVSSKEARETRFWLKLLDRGDLTEIEVKSYLTEIEEIVLILTSIVKTTKESI